MRVLVFGDSITEGDYDTHGGWVARLIQDEFTKKQHNPEEDCNYFINLGVDDNTTLEVLRRFASEVAARRSTPEAHVAVIIAVGINDTIQYRGEKPNSTPEQYEQDLIRLYYAAQEITDHIMFVGLTPVEDEAFPDGLYRNERIWHFEEKLRSFTKQHDVPFVPIYDIFKQNMSVGNKLFVDGLHPNDIGHEIIYLRVKQALAQLFTPDKEEHWFDVIN